MNDVHDGERPSTSSAPDWAFWGCGLSALLAGLGALVLAASHVAGFATGVDVGLTMLLAGIALGLLGYLYVIGRFIVRNR